MKRNHGLGRAGVWATAVLLAVFWAAGLAGMDVKDPLRGDTPQKHALAPPAGLAAPHSVVPTEDGYEENDDQGSAAAMTAGTYNNLACLDDDWYKVELAAGSNLVARMDYNYATADLEMQLVDAAGNLIYESCSADDYEQVTIGDVAAGWYYLRVFSYDGHVDYYDLTITVGGGLYGGISGRVTDSLGNPIENVQVMAYVPGGYHRGRSYTDGNGEYYLGPGPGNYQVGFNAFPDYVAEYYDNRRSRGDADCMFVSAGTVKGGINAVLEQGGTITGRVTDGSAAGIYHVYARAYDASYNYVRGVFTDSSGNYVLNGLPAGTMRVFFDTYQVPTYTGEWYNDRTDFATADGVAVAAGGTVTGKDAVLAADGSINVTAPSSPVSWEAGSVQNITWNSNGTITNVHIEYSTDNGSTWKNVAASTPNDGQFEWSVPMTLSNQCRVRISDAADGAPVDTSVYAFSIVSSTDLEFVNNGVWQTASQGLEGWYVGDFTGDGPADIMNVTNRHQKVFESDGTQFIKLGSWIQALTGLYGWFPGDFNGDLRTDLLRYREVNRTQVFLSTGSAFVKDYVWAEASPGTEGYTVGDFNGDGLDDILTIDAANRNKVFLSTGTAFAAPVKWFTGNSGADGWYAGDFNGDNRTDLVRVNLSLGTQVLLSTGTSFVKNGVWTTALPESNGWFVGDYNADGKDDLMRCGNGMSGVEVFLSTGTAFQYDGYWSNATLRGADWRVGEFNSDGRADLLRYNTANRNSEVFLVRSTAAPAAAARFRRAGTDLNAGIDLRRPVLSPAEEGELLRPWKEKIFSGEEGNWFFALKRAYEEKLGRPVRDTVIYRMLARQLQPEQVKETTSKE